MKNAGLKSKQRIYNGLLALFFLIMMGTAGYMTLENMEFPDALYMTIISITTTGFGEVRPLSHAGRFFTMVIIILGISLLGFVATQLAEFLFNIRFFRRYKMNKQILTLDNHCIICGFGRMGKKICEELNDQGVPFVVIESNNEELSNLEESGYLFIHGDSTIDEILEEAGIRRAKYLIAVTSADANNVYTVLTARNLNPQLHIVSRAIEEHAVSKLEKAGANRVVATIEIGAFRIASELLHPGIIDFMDLVFKGKQYRLQIEEIIIGDRSELIGKALKNTPIRNQLNILSVLIIRANGNMIYNPAADIPLYRGDRLICIGERDNLDKLKKISNHPDSYVSDYIRS